jgi:hypothetical protein
MIHVAKAEPIAPVTPAQATRAPWVLIRTEPRKELAVYSAILDLAADAWLPREPRFTRLARSRNQRQWWAPVLPGCFFAAGVSLADVATVRYFDRIEHDCDGKPIEIPGAMVMHFRRAIDEENQTLVRLAGRRTRKEPRVVKRTFSRRIKPRKAAVALRAEVQRRLTTHNG